MRRRQRFLHAASVAHKIEYTRPSPFPLSIILIPLLLSPSPIPPVPFPDPRHSSARACVSWADVAADTRVKRSAHIPACVAHDQIRVQGIKTKSSSDGEEDWGGENTALKKGRAGREAGSGGVGWTCGPLRKWTARSSRAVVDGYHRVFASRRLRCASAPSPSSPPRGAARDATRGGRRAGVLGNSAAVPTAERRSNRFSHGPRNFMCAEHRSRLRAKACGHEQNE